MSGLRWLLVGLWMAAILYTSSLGQAVTPVSGLAQTLISKLGHILEYGILGVLLLWALRAETWINRSRVGEIVVVALIGGLFAGMDEMRQSFTPGREPRITDALIDLASVIVAGSVGSRWLGRPHHGAVPTAPPGGDQPTGG